VRARTFGTLGPSSIGLEVYQTLATAGASVGPYVTAMTVDTSGAHPLLDACRRAQQAALQAAADLTSLPPTGNLGSVVLQPGESRTITLPSGVNVLDADEVLVGRAAHLTVSGDDWAVIRTPSLHTRQFGDISGYVLFVLAGRGPAVSVGPYSDLVSVGILAPERSVRMRVEASAEGLWADRVTLQGVDLGGTP